MEICVQRKDFFDKLLPLPNDLAPEILEYAKSKKVYVDSEWVALSRVKKTSTAASTPPTPEGTKPGELNLYEPFVEVANTIIDYVGELRPELREQQRVVGRWIDTHGSIPTSQNPNSLRVQPDLSFVPVANAGEMKAMAVDWEEQGGRPPEGEEMPRTTDMPETETTRERQQEECLPVRDKVKQTQKKLPTQWWLQILTIGELKVDRSKSASAYNSLSINDSASMSASSISGKRKDRKPKYNDSAVPQLATYVRQLFMEQLDRRFAFAFTLHSGRCWIHLFDRSGTVNITEAIDINKSPEDFIHVIASLAYLSPEQLGWDPTFQAWDGEKPVPSYGLPLGSVKDCSNAYEIPWVIDSPKNPLEKYVSIRSLHLKSAQVLYGRASIILEVVSLGDWKAKNEEATILVMKQTWQRLPGLESDNEITLVNSSDYSSEPNDWTEQLEELHKSLEREPYEAYILHKAGFAVDSSRLHEAGYVCSDGKQVDTFDFIRKGLERYAPQSLRPAPKVKKNSSSDILKIIDGRSDRWDGLRIDSPCKTPDQDDGYRRPVSRTLTRIFFKLPGWTIKHFMSKEELISALKGGIEEHEKLCRNGVIHRDVSTGNIILSGMGGGMGGHLIDFDHSKITVQFKPFASENVGTLGPGQRDRLRQEYDDTAIDLAEQAYGERAWIYLGVAAAAHGLSVPFMHQLVTFQDLGWDSAGYDLPSFSDRRAGHGYITGTPPFISSHLDGKKPHTAVHDMESFLWILVYISLRYDGPATLKVLSNTQEDIIYRYFHNTDTARTEKVNVFNDEDTFKEDILNNIAEYFGDLKPLIQEWYAVLKVAWTYPKGLEYHYPHGIIQKFLDKAMAQLKASQVPERYLEMTRKEETRRKEYWDLAKTAIKSWKTVDALMKEGKRGVSGQPHLDPPTSQVLVESPPSSPPVVKRARRK